MKRLLSILIISVFVVNCFTFLYTVSADDSVSEYARIMAVLEIMPEMEDAESELSRKVSRGEFAEYIAKLLNIEADRDPDVYFLDVDRSNSYCGILSALYKAGIVSGASNGNFNPERPVLYEEAYKMIVEACGYGAIAEYSGGYPNGYIAVARKYDILVNTGGGELTAGQCAEILFKAATEPIYDRTYLDGDLSLYPSGETLLERYHNIYLYEGVIQAADGTALFDAAMPESGEIVIDGQRVALGEDALIFGDAEYIGIKVKALLRESKSGIDTAVYIWKANTDKKDIVITADDFTGYENYSISYYTDNGNENQVSVSKGAAYIYNGVNVESGISNLYKDFSMGSITLRKTGETNDYNLILIKSYKNLVVGAYGDTTKTLVELDNTNNSICFGDYEYIKIYENGIEVDDAGFAMGDVLTIAQYENKIEVHKNNTSESGVITGIKSGRAYNCIIINEKEYEVDAKCYNKNKAKLKTGVNCTVKTDLFGRVAYIDFDVSSDWLFAYALRIGCKDGMFGEKENMIEVYNQNGEFLTLGYAPKVVFDGNKLDNDGELSVYFPGIDENGVIPMQMIRYKTNSNGLITAVDTCGDEEDSIKECNNGKVSKKIYTPAFGMFYDDQNNQIMVDKNTLVMQVPYVGTSYGEIDKNRELYFDVKPMSSIAAAWQVTIGGYTVGDNDVSPVIIYTSDSADLENAVDTGVIFNSMGTGTDSTGEVYDTICGYSFTGSEVTYLVDDDTKYKNMTDLQELAESDVIGVKTYTKGDDVFVRVVDKVYDNSDSAYEKPTSAQGWSGFVENKMAWWNARIDYFNFIKGNVKTIKKSVLHLSTHPGGEAVQMYDVSKASVFVYDSSEERNRFYIGSLADIAPGMTVVINKTQVAPVGILVYK